MPAENQIKAFAYLRVSGKGQLDGDGFPRQLAHIEAYALMEGIDIVQVFEERAVTGTAEWSDRPAWMKMLASLNGVQTIVIEGLDRLARDMGVQEYILKDLTRRGITLLSTREEDIQSPEPARILFRQMMGAIAQYDRSMIVLKLRGARDRVKAATGRCEGRKPYGHTPEEESTLKIMRTARDAGYDMSTITRYLNHKGLTSRTGRQWNSAVVAKILGRKNHK